MCYNNRNCQGTYQKDGTSVSSVLHQYVFFMKCWLRTLFCNRPMAMTLSYILLVGSNAMKTANIRKTLTIIGALFTGGIGIGLVSMVPETAEAGLTMN
jgi:hypothetical protein